MNVKEWADKLNGLEYPASAIEIHEKEMEADGITVAYGLSDDLLEFRGLIDDEMGAYEGISVKITDKPSVFRVDDNKETAEYNQSQIDNMKTVTSVWCPLNEKFEVWASWHIVTDIPHEPFDILEDGEVYCRGIVFAL